MTIRANSLSDVADAIDQFTEQKKIENWFRLAEYYNLVGSSNGARYALKARALLDKS